MRAMVLNKPRTPLEWTELPERHPGPGEIRVKVLACGVCRTDLHVLDGELPDPKSPIIPGHEISAGSMKSDSDTGDQAACSRRDQ